MKLYQLGVVSLVMFAAAHGNHHDGRDKDHGVELDHHRPMVSHEVKEAMPADNSRHKEPKFKHTDRNDHKYLHNTNSETSKASNAESKDVASLWIKAIASTLLISLAPIFILYFIPLGDGDKTSYSPLPKSSHLQLVLPTLISPLSNLYCAFWRPSICNKPHVASSLL